MITYYLGDEEVNAHLTHLSKSVIIPNAPEILLCVGNSGNLVGRRLRDILRDMLKNNFSARQIPELITSRFDDGTVIFKNDNGERIAPSAFSDKKILVIDGSIKTGLQMQCVVTEILKYTPKQIYTYALALKCGAMFLPNAWGLLIDDLDMAHYMMLSEPSSSGTRLFEQFRYCGYAQKISQTNIPQLALQGVDNLVVKSWVEQARNRAKNGATNVYVYFCENTPKGYFIIGLDVAKKIIKLGFLTAKDQNITASYIYKWAESFGRKSDCNRIQIQVESSYENRYRQIDFKKAPLVANEQNHIVMERDIIYREIFEEKENW